MGTKIGHNTQIGNNNAIGKNAKVEITENEKERKEWFSRHPWLSAIVCSIIAGIILMFSFWDKLISFFEQSAK